MIEPGRRFLDACDIWNSGKLWPAQHHNLDAERTRRGNLAVGRLTPAVLADDRFDPVGEQQLALGGFGERAACNQITRVRHGERRIDRIDAAHEIMVLRCRRERREFLAAEREKDAARCGPERSHRSGDICNFGPAIAPRRLPSSPPQREQPHPGGRSGTSRVRRNRGGVRVRRIDQRGDAFGTQISGEPFGAAKSADPHRHRLRSRRCGAAGERQRDRRVGAPAQAFGEPARFKRPAEDEDAVHGVC